MNDALTRSEVRSESRTGGEKAMYREVMQKAMSRNKEYRCRIEMPWFLAMKLRVYMEQMRAALPNDAAVWERKDIEEIIDRCDKAVRKHLVDLRAKEASR